MSDIAIKFENISKQYRLGEIGTGTLSHDLNRWWHKVRGKEDPYLKIGQESLRSTLNAQRSEDYIWALKDINLEVKQGEVLGIIGKNGAGKSTLLKILSKVTRPTTGIIKTKGRIASLLEVGTGFHPEMTGRENIYMNGSIMGMTKTEITRKFDEIVDFAGVERYIDTPVKRYSSGMTVRLGFAIAAHLEPEILVVDEVLAVGDAEFQNKAIGKMQDVSQKDGRTVLFVSHNMAAIQNLCTKALLLEFGKIVYPIGVVNNVIQYYLSQIKTVSLIKLGNRLDRNGRGNIKVDNFEITNINDDPINKIISGDSIKFKIYYSTINNSFQPKNIRVAISMTRSDGFFISLFDTGLLGQNFKDLEKTEGIFVCIINHCPFSEGLYYLNIAVRQNDIIEDWIQEAYSFEVIHGDFFNTGKIVPHGNNGVLINHKWELCYS
jgi:lipopolysaccharide transport system ATP-binding protein